MLKSVLDQSAINGKVTSNTIMGDLIRLHPEVVDTLIAQGMHCLGCPSAQQESLANACFVHGLDPEIVTKAVNVAIEANKQ